MDTIRDVISQYYKGKISLEGAETLINSYCSKAELPEFVVDAYNRGWISNFNLGLDEDGNII